MKFLHTADLHLGKKVNEYSMLPDQAYIIDRIIEIAEEVKPDGFIIAGDIYDKSIPPAEAVALFDKLLSALFGLGIAVYAISGNHDSAERLDYAAGILSSNSLYIQGTYDDKGMKRIDKSDEYGPLHIYLMPFVKPLHVRHALEDESIQSYEDAMRKVVEKECIAKDERNILITHQFVNGYFSSDSEDVLSIGGTEVIDGSVFEGFDYVALGHLHAPQGTRIRYSGTPLKYSKSESARAKSITLLEVKEKDDITIETIPLTPMRDMRVLRGKYDELMLRSFYEGQGFQNDYIFAELLDKSPIPNAISLLRTIYPNVLSVEYPELEQLRDSSSLSQLDQEDIKDPVSLVSMFYKGLTNEDIDESLVARITEIVEGRNAL